MRIGQRQSGICAQRRLFAMGGTVAETQAGGNVGEGDGQSGGGDQKESCGFERKTRAQLPTCRGKGFCEKNSGIKEIEFFLQSFNRLNQNFGKNYYFLI